MHVHLHVYDTVYNIYDCLYLYFPGPRRVREHAVPPHPQLLLRDRGAPGEANYTILDYILYTIDRLHYTNHRIELCVSGVALSQEELK